MTAMYPKHVVTDSLWLDTLPAHWCLGRLDQVARAWPSNVDKHTVKGEPPVRLCNYIDVYKNASIVEGMDFMAATASREQIERFRIAVGDTLLTKDSETADDIGVPAFVEYEAPDLVCGYHLSIVRPIPGAVDPKFLYWALGAGPTVSQWAVLASGVTRVGIRAGDLSKAVLALPPLEEQRSIADYLDRETARIDTLIEEQQRLIEMLRERQEVVIDAELAKHGVHAPTSLDGSGRYEVPDGWKVLLLGRVLQQLTNGFVGPTRDILVEDGVRYIQSTHIKAGQIDFDRRPFYVSREWHDERPRIHLQTGDVLIVQTGDIGNVAVVPPNFGEASCHALQIARVHPELLSGEYLATFLSSRLGYHSLLAKATGALHPHLEAGIRAVPIVVPPSAVQAEIVRETAKQSAKIDALIAESGRFIELSKERRSALITAAVTGQVDVREMV